MRELDRQKWLPVESKQAIELVQLQLQKQGVQFKKQIGLLTVMLFDLSKPYSDGSKSYDRIIYRRFV
jgi:hypothetical protein